MIETFEGTKSLHTPVLIKEVLHYIAPKVGEKFLDCTFGAGGYSTKFLDCCNCEVTAIDRDPGVKNFAQQLKDAYNNRFNFVETDFSNTSKLLNGAKFDGIVMDLGVSSMQLDNAVRGFSFMQDGPLDMRMSQKGFTAAEFINDATEEEIADVIYKFGEETLSRRIARKLVYERKSEPITTTARLATIVRAAIGFRKGKIDSATKTFQAIRIHVNNELGELNDFLEEVLSLLSPGGRLVIVSFHSLEDGIVKQFLKNNSIKVVARSKYAQKAPEIEDSKSLKILTKKPILPGADEIKANPRSRSAKLRAAIKIESKYVD